jgi:hypothetical protein
LPNVESCGVGGLFDFFGGVDPIKCLEDISLFPGLEQANDRFFIRSGITLAILVE